MRRHLGSIAVMTLLIALLASCAPAAPAPATPAKPAAPAVPAAPAAPATPAAPAAAAPKTKTTIRLLTPGVGTSNYVFTMAMSFILEKRSPWLRAELVPLRGFPEILLFLLEGKGHIAITGAGEVDRATKGQGEFKPFGQTKDLRFITSTSEISVIAVVADKSPIKAFTASDLKGKTVTTVEIGSLSAIVARAYVQATGLDPDKDIKWLYAKAADMPSYIHDGTADVLMHVTGIPNPIYEEMFSAKPSRFVPFPKELTKKANEISGAGLGDYTIPAGLLKGMKEPVLSGSTFGLGIARENLSEDIVYELTKLWWEYADERNEIHSLVAGFGTFANLKRAAAIGIPFHKGALKYYAEKGWFK